MIKYITNEELSLNFYSLVEWGFIWCNSIECDNVERNYFMVIKKYFFFFLNSCKNYVFKCEILFIPCGEANRPGDDGSWKKKFVTLKFQKEEICHTRRDHTEKHQGQSGGRESVENKGKNLLWFPHEGTNKARSVAQDWAVWVSPVSSGVGGCL